MKAPFFFLLLLAINNLTALSQGKILLKDDFKNNKNGWELRNDIDFLVDIKNGALHLEKFERNRVRNGCLWYSKTIPGFNTLENFSITFYARFLSGGDLIDLIDLQWGSSEDTGKGRINDNLYQLNIWMNGKIKFDYFNRRWTYFVSKGIKTALHEIKFEAGKYNKYEVLQQDGFIILKINDKELFKHAVTPIAGNSIGFQQCLKSAWEINKIIVRQLKTGNEKKDNTDTTHHFVSANLSSGQSQPGDNNFNVFPNPFTNYLTVRLNVEKEETVQISLIDINGVIIQQHKLKFQKGLQQFSMYADVVPGTYVVQAQTGDKKVLTTTIVRQ